MTHEEKIAQFVKQNPSCSWEDIKEKFNAIARPEVFRQSKRELKYIKTPNIKNKVEKLFNTQMNWKGFDEFYQACIKDEEINEIVHKRTIYRTFQRLQNTREWIRK